MTGAAAGIARWATYIPRWRLQGSSVAAAWRGSALSGSRSVRGPDEDSVTLGVEAALACLEGAENESVDAVFFATTSPAHLERQGAAIIAGVLGRSEILTADIQGTVRAGTTALRLGLTAVRSGGCRSVLVVASDARPAEPGSLMEQFFGDGAGALLLTPNAPVGVVAEASLAEQTPGAWRRTEDDFVRSFDPRAEMRYGYADVLATVIRRGLRDADLRPEEVSGLAVSAPQPGSDRRLAGTLELPFEDVLTTRVGYLGAAHPIVALAHALERVEVGSRLVVASHGEGADCIVLGVTADPRAGRPRRSVVGQLEDDAADVDYPTYLRYRRILDAAPGEPRTSPLTYWRDRNQALSLIGMQCRRCQTVQFPANRLCVECGRDGPLEPRRMGRQGRVFTFTLDHLVGGNYYEDPVCRAVVDLHGGGRLLVEMTDGQADHVGVGDEVQLTLRRLHDGAGFPTYYWKARPAAAVTAALAAM